MRLLKTESDPRHVCGVTLLVLLVEILVAGSILAQEPSTLRGRILSKSSLPLSEAEVRIVGDSISAVTDSTGRFHLGQLEPGLTVVQVRRIGYNAQYLQVHAHSRRGPHYGHHAGPRGVRSSGDRSDCQRGQADRVRLDDEVR